MTPSSRHNASSKAQEVTGADVTLMQLPALLRGMSAGFRAVSDIITHAGHGSTLMVEEWCPFSVKMDRKRSTMRGDFLVSFDMIRVVGQPINSETDINVIAAAAVTSLC